MPSQPTGRLSFFLTRALYRPGVPLDTVAQRRDAAVGFMSTGYLAEVLADTLAAGLPEGTFFEVRDGTTSLASGGSHNGHESELRHRGHRPDLVRRRRQPQRPRPAGSPG